MIDTQGVEPLNQPTPQQSAKQNKFSTRRMKTKEREREKGIHSSQDSSLMSDSINQQAFSQHINVVIKTPVKKSKQTIQKKIVFNRPQEIITKND